jgi:hypothetical protein
LGVIAVNNVINDVLNDDSVIKERFEEYKKESGTTLNELYKTFDKWLLIKDKKRLDIVLATALTRKMKGTPIWLFIVGPSGDGKSEQIMALKDNETTFTLHEITSNTLVSGMSDEKNNYDLAPKLKDKLVMIPDMAQLLNLHPNDKAKVWGQLRELYDGRAGKNTGISQAKYENIRVTLIACATPSIDSQILVFSHLGTRELLYRTCEEDSQALMDKVMENEKSEDSMKRELNAVCTKFIQLTMIKDQDMSTRVYRRMKGLINYLRYLRASSEHDSFTGELRNKVYPEQPTRSLKQFKRLYVALKSLDENYTDERAFEILKHIVLSSIIPLRHKILQFLIDNKGTEFSTNKIANTLKIGRKSTGRELSVLWNLGLINGHMEEMEQEWKNFFKWEIDDKGLNLHKEFVVPI